MAMKRTAELEVRADGTVDWHEGHLDLAPPVAERIASFPPRTLIEVIGTYERPSKDVKILHVTRMPTSVLLPVERALHGWRQPELVAGLRGALERDPSGNARAVLAGLAAREQRIDDARTHFRDALRAGTERAADEVLAFAWSRAQPLELARELEDALLAIVWRNPWAWSDWCDPIVCAAHQRLSARDNRPPWHFGGRRIEPDRAIVEAWWVERAAHMATTVDGVGIAEVRGMSAKEQRAFLHASRRRDEQANADAQRAVERAHPRDSNDSPPDSADPGALESDQPLIAWLHYHHGDHGHKLEELAGTLVAAAREVDAPSAMALAQTIDAVVLASALAPAFAARLEQVPFARLALRDGFAIARAGDTFLLLRAPGGAFGPWTVVEGAQAAILAAVPDALRASATSALARPKGCELSLDAEAKRLVATPEPVPVKRAPEPPAAPRERFVTHPTFGRGRVVEVSGGKLVIEFETAGRKTLLERFVTDAK